MIVLWLTAHQILSLSLDFETFESFLAVKTLLTGLQQRCKLFILYKKKITISYISKVKKDTEGYKRFLPALFAALPC